MPRLAPEEETIDVERIESSSSDELLITESKGDRPRLDVQNGGRHAFDMESDTLQTVDSNAVASTSRVRQDGPSTQALAKELGHRSNSPILQFDDDEHKPSSNNVTELVRRYEKRNKESQHVDLRNVRKKMKPKVVGVC